MLLFCETDQIQVKLHSFLVLQKIFRAIEVTELQKNIKRLYLLILKYCKSVNTVNYSLIQFMLNCFVELMSINKDLSYMLMIQFMQSFIQHLKMGYREKSKENIFMIYNWQIYFCFSLWTKISQVPGFEQLKYPIIQLVLGQLNLFWTEKYFPLFLKFFEIVRSIGGDSEYVPVYKLLFKMLESQGFRQKKKQEDSRKFDFVLNVKATQNHLTSQTFWNDLFKEIIDQITLQLSDQSEKLYFPEISIMVLKELKSLKKQLTFPVYNKKIVALIKATELRAN